MLRRILDAVEELLEVVVPHLEPETSQRGSTKDALSSKIVKMCVPLSWKTWMTFCLRRTGRVRQLSCCHWKAWIDGELDQREGELASPLRTPIPAPTILPWAENIRKIHVLLFLEIPMNGWIKFWFRMYSWLSFWSRIQMLCSFLPQSMLA